MSSQPPLAFTKMHGLGNDFVIIDLRQSSVPPQGGRLPPHLIKALGDRHQGVGCDQLVMLNHPTLEGADVLVRFYNPDGSEAGACGNASRCVAKMECARLGRDAVTLQTARGLLPARRLEGGLVEVAMGRPLLAGSDVPLAPDKQGQATDFMTVEALGQQLEGGACSMGNPHFTVFSPLNLDEGQLAALGAALEHHPLFPERANIGFAKVIGPHRLQLKVWERGTGFTPACGSGACAAAVNAIRRGVVARDQPCEVAMEHGALLVDWPSDSAPVLMTGPAVTVFEGVLSPAGLAQQTGAAKGRSHHD
ncbi:diaminopimelate epimerase [Formicincola oecophyllae]|uniref:Diaminopimelate epimerase n=1 Tax=Formicincola oecophyllae TaxID=2558361 RepID=A0A4Y6UBT8_9PROT|nr:diaminopimelate epimerase [Formicincola oecophyllae]QDH14390.1 diaminopimelate epimerase [Formicincola oecophyllae]